MAGQQDGQDVEEMAGACKEWVFNGRWRGDGRPRDKIVGLGGLFARRGFVPEREMGGKACLPPQRSRLKTGCPEERRDGGRCDVEVFGATIPGYKMLRTMR
jgi:hypothetical protein